MLARDVVEGELRPWENKQRRHSPQQVRRGLTKYLPQLGTPAPPPQPRGYPKGRKKGAVVRRATRFPVDAPSSRGPVFPLYTTTIRANRWRERKQADNILLSGPFQSSNC